MTNGTQAAGPPGALAIGCFASICRNRLAERLLAFAQNYPDIELGVHEMMRASLLPALDKGELALAIIPGGDEDAGRSVTLWQDRVMVAIHRDHVLAGAETVPPEALLEQVFLVSRQQHGGDMHRFLSQRALPANAAPSSVLLDLNPARLLAEVAADHGIFLLCGSHDDLTHPEVVIRPVDGARARFQVRAYWQGEQPQSMLAALIAMLTPSLRDG